MILDNPSAAAALGWTLLHFLWQGAMIAALLRIALTLMRRASAEARYLASCGAMAAALAIAAGTFVVQIHSQAVPAPVYNSRAAGADSPGQPWGMPAVVVREFKTHSFSSSKGWLDAMLPWIVQAWIVGVLLCSCRVGYGWWQLRRWVAEGVPLADLQETMRRLAQRMALKRPVRLLESAQVLGPAALGWLRPVVLVPASTLTGLAPAQLEAILAHELAHVLRHDYAVNLLQTCVETLLFYHPAVWWISRQIREEREHCCDDLAVAVCGDPIGYARALAALEERRAGMATLAVAASDGPLLKRIRRVLGLARAPQPGAGGLTVIFVVTALVGLAVGLRAAIPTLESSGSPPPTSDNLSPSSFARTNLLPTTLSGPGTNLSPTPDARFTRVFKLDPNTFVENVRARLGAKGQNRAPALPNSTPNFPSGAPTGFNYVGPIDQPGPAGRAAQQELVRAYLQTAAGVEFPAVDLAAPGQLPSEQQQQRAMFYNHANGLLLVRATLQELDQVEQAIQKANLAVFQVQVEVKFVEADDALVRDLPLNQLPTTGAAPVLIKNTVLSSADRAPLGSSAPATKAVPIASQGRAGVLTPQQARALIRAIEQSAGSDILAAPRVTTLSGQQAQVQVVELKNIMLPSNGSLTNSPPNTIITNAVPLGPTVDLIPTVLEDGKTIDVTVLPSLTEFLGYDDPGPFILHGNTVPQPAPLPVPRFRVRQTAVRASIPDGQTLVIVGFGAADPEGRDPNKRGKQVLVLLTPRIMDPAGIPLHPE
jgi:beta-lactamase regulating signal transducer with metallopeptidase domain